MNNDLICYKQMPVWTADTIPAAFLSRHNTQEGTWGKLHVLEGRLKFYGLDEHDNILSEQELSPDSGVHTIEPQQWHKIEPLGEDLRVQLEFHCDKADYFRKKYGMTATHSAVKAATATVPPGKTLDLGCGQGRNALYLALKGYDVTAVDQNPNPLYALSDLAAQKTCRCKSRATTSTPPPSTNPTTSSSPPSSSCSSKPAAYPTSSPTCSRTPRAAATT